MFTMMVMAAAAATAQPAYKPRPISAADQAEIKRQADKVLLDGPSARWEWGARLDPELYCTRVNAKNAFGAYSGWRPAFFQFNRLVMPDDDVMLDLYQTICSNAGYIESIAKPPSAPQ